MSLSAFFIILLKSLKTVFATTVVFLLIRFVDSGDSGSDDVSWWILVPAYMTGCVAVSLLVALAQYLPKRFYVAGGNLVFSHGLLRRQTTTIPLDSIHSLRTKCGLVYQLLGLRGIAFDTLASKGEEIELILSESDWRSLLRYIEKGEQSVSSASSSASSSVSASGAASRGAVQPNSVFIYFRNKYLLADVFCQNHLKGLAVVAALLAAVFDKISDFVGKMELEEIEEYVGGVAGQYSGVSAFSPALVLGLLVAAYIIVMLLWVGKAFLLYFNMTATIDGNLLTFSRGLFSRLTSRFSYDKVCTVCVKRNFLERRFRLCTMSLRQALFATADKEEDNIRIYSSEASLSLLRWWLGKDYEDEATLLSARSGQGVFWHSILPGVTVLLVAAAALCYWQLYVWTMIPAVCLPVVLLKGYCTMRRSRISLRQTYMVVENGRFADVRNYVKYENVEVVMIRQTPFTRLSGRVSIVFSTSGSSFTVRSIPRAAASRIADTLLRP